MDAREYLQERPDVRPDEIDEIIGIARRLHGDDRLVHAGGIGTFGSGIDLDERYLERAVRIHRRQKADAERAAAEAKKLRALKTRRTLSLVSAIAVVVLSLGAGFYMLGFYGASNIEIQRSALEQAAEHVHTAADRLVSAGELGLEALPGAADELRPTVERLRKRNTVDQRVDAAGHLDVAFDARFASMPAPRGPAADTWRRAQEQLQSSYHAVQVEAERYEVAEERWLREVNSASGRVGIWLKLASKDP
ncbi:MAG: hypothetical protein H6741_34115 [Alphaproteobacteria bacterium]|nr:hypothetical protein [Alphaproteobacteria bacterium]